MTFREDKAPYSGAPVGGSRIGPCGTGRCCTKRDRMPLDAKVFIAALLMTLAGIVFGVWSLLT